MELNAEQVLQKIENGELEVNYEYYNLEESDGCKSVVHGVLFPDGEVSDYEVEFYEYEDIQEMREAIYEAVDNGEQPEHIYELEKNLNDRIGNVEHNDVFDYDGDVSVLEDGFYI